MVRAHLAPPPGEVRDSSAFLDPRRYLSLFYMLLVLVTGIVYNVIAVMGLRGAGTRDHAALLDCAAQRISHVPDMLESLAR
jgi:hypothetical protein